MKINPLGDSAMTACCDEVPTKHRSAWMVALRESILSKPSPITDCVIAFDSITIYFDIVQLHRSAMRNFEGLAEWIREVAVHNKVKGAAHENLKLIEIPVVYGGNHGPDLHELAKSKKRSVDEIVDLHTQTIYTATAIGFQPGFAYLEGLADVLHTPRRSTPRTVVPAGSVAIGGSYTGVYPSASPGGWHLIGKTESVLFDVQRTTPALIQAGQRVRFVAIRGKR